MSKLEAPESSVVLMEKLVNFILVLLESRELGKVKVGNHAAHLGLSELDDTLAKVAEVLEKVVVVDVNKFPLKTSASGQTIKTWDFIELTPT